MSLKLFSLLLASCLLLACGQKGPLYLPEPPAQDAAQQAPSEDDKASGKTEQ